MGCQEFVTILNHETDRLITNWLPICISGVTRYVTDEYTIDNTDWSKTFVGKLYKQWVNWSITDVAPAGIGVATEWYCSTWTQSFEYIVWCEAQQVAILSVNALSVPWTTGLSFSNPLSTSYTTSAWYVDKVIVDWGDGSWPEIVSQSFMNGTPIVHTTPTSLVAGEYNAYVYVSTLDSQIFQIQKFKYSYNQTTNIVIGIWGEWQGSQAYRTIRNLIQVRNEQTWALTYQTDAWVVTTIWAGNQFYSDCNKPITWVLAIEDIELSNGIHISELATNPLATHAKTTGVNVSVPAWFRSVSIVKTSVAWVVNIEWLPRIYTQWWSEQFWADEYIYNWQRRVLPAFTVTNTWGSTFNWIAIS